MILRLHFLSSYEFMKYLYHSQLIFILWFLLLSKLSFSSSCQLKIILHGLNVILPEKTNDIVVTWSTFNDTDSLVLYRSDGNEKQVAGSSKIFIDGGKMKRKQWIHRVTLKDLKFNTRYGKYFLKF